MAHKCSVTNKGRMSGNNVSDALNRTKRRFNVNLQTKTVVDKDGNKKRIKVSAKGIKTLKKQGLLK